jgi:Dolichyl-phosphate-mannose-protein mannosyltransferase
VLRNDWFVVVLLALLAAFVRWLFILYNPHADGFLIYQGQPLSDGCSYTFKAMSIAQGHGLPTVQQPAVRPFYPIALACFYTWTGFSLWAVAVLNIAAGALTAGLIYLCGMCALNRFCALGAALFFAIDPSQLMQTPQAGTEPLGLLFFVASTYTALLAFKSRRESFFFLTGLFIGLSNLTRTLTILSLPFYLALIFLLFGARGRAWKAASIYMLLMILGVALVVLPWVIRQERTYGIASISDNIGEAFYAASSPKYKQWTPLVRKDADSDGVSDTVGDRYRYFIRRGEDNVKQNPGFYLRSVATSLWDYANTFNPSSRASTAYAEEFSSAAKAQRVFMLFMVVFLTGGWSVAANRPLTPLNLLWLVSAVGLTLVYLALPSWLAFAPIIAGFVFFCKAGRTSAGVVMFGTLAMAAVGSAMFANPTLFRAILMTDWLFMFYFLAAVWFPLEFLTRQSSRGSGTVFARDVEERSQFQATLSLLSHRLARSVIGLLLGFLVLSSGRLVALTIENPARRGERQLTGTEMWAMLRRLRQPPFGVVANEGSDLRVFAEWWRGAGAQPGKPVVLVQKFEYYYYIPAGKAPPRGQPHLAKPYARSLVILPQFDYIIAGEIPSSFCQKPIIFVGKTASAKATNGAQLARLRVDGLALIPLDEHRRPDYARAVCAPPSVQPDVARP